MQRLLSDDRWPDDDDEIDRIEDLKERARKTMADDRNDIGFIWVTANSKFKKIGGKGDTVIQLWTRANRQKPVVLQFATVKNRNENELADRVEFFLEEQADIEEKYINIAKFQKEARNAGLAGKLGPNTTREISRDVAAQIKNRCWPSR